MIDFAVLEITERCNLRCSHCYLGEKRPISMDVYQIEHILESLLTVGCRRITLSGGEPFAVPDLLREVVSEAKRRDFTVIVVTNGTLVHNADSKLLEEIDHIQVSLDGLQETHDSIRGKGTFSAACAGIQNLISKGCQKKTSVQMTVSALNQKEFFDVYELVHSFGLRMSVERVTAVGCAADYRTLDFAQYQKILDFIIDRNLLSSDPLVNARKMQRIGLKASKLSLSGGCSAGKNGLAVTVSGEVLPCVRIRESCGNLYNTDLKAIVSSNRFRSYASPLGDCVSCENSGICGGCRADAITHKTLCYQ